MHLLEYSNLKKGGNQFPFLLEVSHRFGKILLGALVPQLSHTFVNFCKERLL